MNKKMKLFCKKKLEQPSYYNTIKYYELFSPIVVLLGPNGTGKSTTIREMKEDIPKNRSEAKVISYSTSYDDTVRKHTNQFDFRPEALAAAFLSEGERMNQSFFTWIKDIMLPAVLKDSRELYIFIDEADSGLSMDKINEAFRGIIFIVKEEVKRDRNIHVVITANSYELAETFENEYNLASFIWVPTGDYIDLGSYNKFKKRYMEYYKEMNFDESGKRRD